MTDPNRAQRRQAGRDQHRASAHMRGDSPCPHWSLDTDNPHPDATLLGGLQAAETGSCGPCAEALVWVPVEGAHDPAYDGPWGRCPCCAVAWAPRHGRGYVMFPALGITLEVVAPTRRQRIQRWLLG